MNDFVPKMVHVKMICIFIIILAPVRMVMCDMVTGSLDRIINSGLFPWLLWRLGATRYIIWKQKASYLVTTQVHV